MSSTEGRAVFFDLVGTLIRPAGSVGTQYSRVAREFGMEAAPEALDLAFEQAMRAAPPMAFAGRPQVEIPSLERAWWRDLVRDVVGRAGLSATYGESRFDTYFDALYRHFATAAAWAVYPDVVPALSSLRAGGSLVGLVTNYDARVYPLLEALELRAWFDCVAIPGLVGAAKPDPAIFRYALEQVAVAPERSAYVGDLVDEDVYGARAAGMRSILLDRERRHRTLSGVIRIESLEGLVAALGAEPRSTPAPQADGDAGSAPKTTQN